jgi:hypothetical protein
MPRRSAVRTVVASILVLVTVALGMGWATGGLPLLEQTGRALSFWLSAWLPPPGTTGTRTAASDAGVPVHRQATPLSNTQLGAPLVHGAFVTACGAPDNMKVVVTLAVRMGHAVDVTVKTRPPDPVVVSCVEHATRDLQWDISPKTGRVTVTY